LSIHYTSLMLTSESLYSNLFMKFQFLFFFSSRRRHTRSKRDWSSDVCSSDLLPTNPPAHNCSLAALPFTSMQNTHYGRISASFSLPTSTGHPLFFFLRPLISNAN